jgi:Domain of unknown function (DUF4439)
MTRTDALQAVLAGEHAAVYAFGVVGAQLRGTADEGDAVAAYHLHLARRDLVTASLVAAGATPVGSAPAYDLGDQVTSASAARALAAKVELGLCGPYADLVGVTEQDERTRAADWTSEAALQTVGWGGKPVAFPGLAERA